MSLQTKLAIPPPRPSLIPRSRLTERLNQGLAQGRRLGLVSAPAGFGKTTLVSHWAQQTERPVDWLSLDESDNDLIRFLTYFTAALQTIDAQPVNDAMAFFARSSVKQNVLGHVDPRRSAFSIAQDARSRRTTGNP